MMAVQTPHCCCEEGRVLSKHVSVADSRWGQGSGECGSVISSEQPNIPLERSLKWSVYRKIQEFKVIFFSHREQTRITFQRLKFRQINR